MGKLQNKSNKGKENQSKNKYKHYLGSRGYSGEKFQNRLKEAFQKIANDKAVSSDPSTQGSTTILSQEQFLDMSVQYRHVSWTLGHTKQSADGEELLHPNPDTEAIVKTIVRI